MLSRKFKICKKTAQVYLGEDYDFGTGTKTFCVCLFVKQKAEWERIKEIENIPTLEEAKSIYNSMKKVDIKIL